MNLQHLLHPAAFYAWRERGTILTTLATAAALSATGYALYAACCFHP
nr:MULTISPECIES: hypothetical protein [unclassified Streptomyces]